MKASFIELVEDIDTSKPIQYNDDIGCEFYLLGNVFKQLVNARIVVRFRSFRNNDIATVMLMADNRLNQILLKFNIDNYINEFNYIKLLAI